MPHMSQERGWGSRAFGSYPAASKAIRGRGLCAAHRVSSTIVKALDSARHVGNILAVMCAAWGNQTPPKAAFCDHRGIPPVGQMPASPSRLLPRRPQTPVNYTPRYLAEKILTSRFALEGERKRATILFADLKGSMELLADRDPEDARRLLDTVLTLMMDAVHRYEGTVNQVLGDGIMAPFGAPIAYEDHAVRGCYEA
jgi:Adenylate and Guanylate cyclase catalytic domain